MSVPARYRSSSPASKNNQPVDKPKNFFAAVTPLFRFSNACAAEKHLISEKPLNKRFFKDTGVALAEHNNRLPPVADERRAFMAPREAEKRRSKEVFRLAPQK